ESWLASSSSESTRASRSPSASPCPQEGSFEDAASPTRAILLRYGCSTQTSTHSNDASGPAASALPKGIASPAARLNSWQKRGKSASPCIREHDCGWKPKY